MFKTVKSNNGVLKRDYYEFRNKRVDYKYRVNRRTLEVQKVIKKNFQNLQNLSILDIGTADGRMLSMLNQIFDFKQAVGIDKSAELISTNKDKSLRLEIGDGENLKFKKNTFNIVTIISTIDHVKNPKTVLDEAYRVLKEGGVVIITVANPIYDVVAEKIGYECGDHNARFSISKLGKLLNESNFKVIFSKYFMLCPFFKIPFESGIERLFNMARLGRLMTNQLVVGKK